VKRAVCAVAPRALELQHDVTGAIALEPLKGDRGARDVAAQPFEFLSLMRSSIRSILALVHFPWKEM
jgi:hypothetical protein